MLTACTAPNNKEASKYQAVISNVNIINVRDGSVSKSKDIVIDSGKVKIIQDHEANKIESENIIDGTDRFIMPGLTEMHAHIPSSESGKEYTEQVLFLYLSNGVTTIRGMLGHSSLLDLRKSALNNEILSPRIFTSSPSLNGNTITSVDEARKLVTTYANDGYDFLKIHPGLKLDVFEELVKTANELGIPYAGHVPVDVGIRKALSSKYASIDHVDGFLEGLVPTSYNIDRNENGFFGYNFTDLVDTTLIDNLVEMSKQNKVWIVPTQSLYDRWFSPVEAEKYASEPEMKYMPKSTIDNWIKNKNDLTGNDNYNKEQWERFNNIRNLLIKKLHKNGYGLLLGSDAPQVFNVPGFSIHHELEGMMNAGLSTLEAIQIGTINPAKYFNMEGEFGEILEGASADFILLENNPLEDMKNIKNPFGVMVRGKWLSREAINNRLKEIEEYVIQNE